MHSGSWAPSCFFSWTDTPEGYYHWETRRLGSFEGGVTRANPCTQGVAGCLGSTLLDDSGVTVSGCYGLSRSIFVIFLDQPAAKWTKQRRCIFVQTPPVYKMHVNVLIPQCFGFSSPSLNHPWKGQEESFQKSQKMKRGGAVSFFVDRHT